MPKVLDMQKFFRQSNLDMFNTIISQLTIDVIQKINSITTYFTDAKRTDVDSAISNTHNHSNISTLERLGYNSATNQLTVDGTGINADSSAASTSLDNTNITTMKTNVQDEAEDIRSKVEALESGSVGGGGCTIFSREW